MAHDIKIIDIMKEIGCGDGFHIPVANEENQLLEKEVNFIFIKLKLHMIQLSIYYYFIK